jgi:hypothetical protein
MQTVNPSAWSIQEQEAFADRVFADFDNLHYTYSHICIAAVIRRQQAERKQRQESLRQWLTYFRSGRRANPRFID